MWPWIIGGGVVAAMMTAEGYAAGQTGQGLNQAGNGALKLVIAGAIGFYIYTKVK